MTDSKESNRGITNVVKVQMTKDNSHMEITEITGISRHPKFLFV